MLTGETEATYSNCQPGPWENDCRMRRAAHGQTVAPEKEQANKAVCALIAGAAGTPRRSVVIERGHASRDKLALVEGLTEDELMSRLGKPML